MATKEQTGKGRNTNANPSKEEVTVEVIKREGLEGRGITALRAIAKDLGVSGYTKFRKGDEEELKALIIAATQVVVEDDVLTPTETTGRSTVGPRIKEKDQPLKKAQKAFSDTQKDRPRRARRATAAMLKKATDEQMMEWAGKSDEEIELLRIQGKLEEEARNWKIRQEVKLRQEGARNALLPLVAKYEGGYDLSVSKNPVVENAPKVRVQGLSPDLITIKAKFYKSIYEDPKGYEPNGYVWHWGDYKIQSTSPLAQWLADKNVEMTCIVIEERGELRKLVYTDLATDYEAVCKKNNCAPGEYKYIFGNFKGGDHVVAAVATLDTWTKCLGEDPRLYANPNKPIALLQTPHNKAITGIEGAKYLRARVVDDEFVGMTPNTKDLKHIKGPDGKKMEYGAYPLNDGNMLTVSTIFHTSVKEHNKQRDDQLRYDKEVADGVENPRPVYKAKEHRVSNAQIRVHSEVDAEFYSDMVKLNAEDPNIKIFGEGETLPLPKCKPISNQKRAVAKFEEYGFPIHAQDAIIGLSNFKTRKGDLKHGDIVLIPIAHIRVISVKQSDGKSSIGIQCQRLAWDITTQLINTALDKAKTVVDALNGVTDAFNAILQSDEDVSFEDAPLIFIKTILCSIKEADGSWRIPMYTSLHNVLMSRVYTYLTQNVYKVRLSDYAFYLECNEELDRKEIEHFKKTGEWVYYMNGASKNKLTKLQYKGIHNPETGEMVPPLWNVGRNPMVGPGNLMGMIWNEENGTTDCIEISCRALWTMFGDVDGDTCIIFPHYKLQYPTYTRNLPVKESKGESKDVALPGPSEFIKICCTAVDLIVDSASNTGILDNLGRQIIIERALAGDRMSFEEILDMGDKIQGAIDGMKHSDQGSLKYDEYLKNKYGVLPHGLKHSEVNAARASKNINAMRSMCEQADVRTAKLDNDQLLSELNRVAKGDVKSVKASPWLFKALRKDGGVSGSHVHPSRALGHIIKALNNAEDLNGFPYQDMVNVLRHSKTRIVHNDATVMKERCYAEWRKYAADLKARKYPWSLANLEEAAWGLMEGSSVLPGNVTGYKKDNAELRKRVDAGMDPADRREAYALLNRTYSEHIDNTAAFVIRVNNAEYTEELATQLKRQLMLYIGWKSFRSGMSRDEITTEMAPYSSAGGCFWCFPMLDCLVWFCKQFNADNPYMAKAEESVKIFIKKREEREREKAQELAEGDALGI